MQQPMMLADATAPGQPTAALPLSAWIAHGGRRRACFVVDLSSDGARLHCSDPLPAGAGARIELQLEGGPARAALVAWRDGERMGLRFAAAPEDAAP